MRVLMMTGSYRNPTNEAQTMATQSNTTGKKSDISSDIFGSVLTLTFSNGESLELDVATLSPQIQVDAALHGVKQKLVDAAAIARDTATGRSATIADKYAAVREVFDRITGPTPTWNKVRTAGESGGNSLLLRALMQRSGKSRAEIEAFLEPHTKEEKAAMSAREDIAAIIATLRKATIDPAIDTDDLLSGLI
jgi:hypothetical protein